MLKQRRALLISLLLVILLLSLTLHDFNLSRCHQDTYQTLLNYISSFHKSTNLLHSCNTTIVTAYYRISSKHSHENYLKWIINFLSIKDCLVVWVDPSLEDLLRALRPPSYPTLFISRPLASSLVASMLDGKDWDRQEDMDPEAETRGHSRDLYIVWNEKTNFMKMAADINTFESTYFLWMDIGAVRHADYNHKTLVQQVPSTPGVLLLNVAPFQKNELVVNSAGESLADFSHVDRIGGGAIGCDVSSLATWHHVFYFTFNSYRRRGSFLGKDQSVMASACLASPGLCLLVDGTRRVMDAEPRWFRMMDIYNAKNGFRTFPLLPVNK